MYAIIETGGKQYQVEEGQSIFVEKLNVEKGFQVSAIDLAYHNNLSWQVDEYLDVQKISADRDRKSVV